MSKNAGFQITAPLYWSARFAAIPLDGKRPLVKSWQSFCVNIPSAKTQSNWLRDFPDKNIGLALGCLIEDDFRLAAIDVDCEEFVSVVESLLDGPLIWKKGKKGKTYFVKATKDLNSTAIKSKEFGHVMDFLSLNKQTVLPPSIHPETQTAYFWGEVGLLDIALDDLPVFDSQQLNLLRAVIGSKEAAVLLQGEGTHDAALSLTAKLVRHGENNLIQNVIASLLPKSYSGDTPEELSRMIMDARNKGFDLPRKEDTFLYDPGDHGPRPLGYSENNSFIFYLPDSRQVLSLSSQQLITPAGLLGIAGKSFWTDQFPIYDGDGNPTDKMAPQWAGDTLMNECRKAGPFALNKVRGRGIWFEKDRLIVNLNGKIPSGTENVYVCFDPLDLIENAEKIDPEKVLAWFSHFNWKTKFDYILIFGWSVLAPICGAVDWRPHIFVSGPRNTGKTTLIRGLSGLLGPLGVVLDGQSTEAGIRQKLGADSLPVILDEFESDGNLGRLKAVIKLARSASSAEGAVARGTPEGRVLQFNIRTMFLFGAITPTISTAADASRIIQTELSRHENDPKKRKLIETDAIYLEQAGEAWCQRSISLVDKIRPAIETFRTAMPAGDSRLMWNMAILFAAAFLGLQNKAPSQDEAQKWVEKYESLIGAHSEPHTEDDALDCLNHLLLSVTNDAAIGELLGCCKRAENQNRNSDIEPNLSRVGVRWQEAGFVVANKHPTLTDIYKGTRWEGGSWRSALRQLEGAKPAEAVRFSGTAQRGTWVPDSYVEESEIETNLNF